MAAAFGFFPARVFGQTASTGPGQVMSTLAAYMSAARSRALPEEVTEQAKFHLLDTLAAMISGSEVGSLSRTSVRMTAWKYQSPRWSGDASFKRL